jgi:hypothetical protein
MKGLWFFLCSLPSTFFCKGQATFSKLYDYADTTIWGQSILIADTNFYIIGEGYTYDIGLSISF